jgi:hypothetical protein
MSEVNGTKTEELAYLLWEQQGRPENRSAENWLEAECIARSLAAATKDEIEADLRMRGLGPLTQDESLSRGNARQSENSSGSSGKEKSEHGISGATPMIASCVAGTALVIALGLAFSGKRDSRFSLKRRQHVIHHRSSSCRMLVWRFVLPDSRRLHPPVSGTCHHHGDRQPFLGSCW